MGECSNDYVVKHTAQITELKTDVEHMKIQINNLSDIKDAVVELKLLQQEQVKSNKKFERLYEETMKSNAEVSSTLKGINENLNSLNNRTNSLEEKIDEIDEKGKLDWRLMIKDWLPKLIAGGIIYWILQTIGVIKF